MPSALPSTRTFAPTGTVRMYSSVGGSSGGCATAIRPPTTTNNINSVPPIVIARLIASISLFRGSIEIEVRRGRKGHPGTQS